MHDCTADIGIRATEAIGTTIALHQQATVDHPALRVFAAIPPRFGVEVVRLPSVLFKVGEIAVYDELWTSGREQDAEPFDDGSIYVVEFQRPRANMGWDLYDQHNRNYPGRPNLHIDRSLVYIRRCRWPGAEHKWMIHPLANFHGGMGHCSDGPYEDFQIGDKVIGKVVGIYAPSGRI